MGLLKLNLPEKVEDFNICTVLGITEEQLDASANKLADMSVRLAKAMVGKPGGINNNMELLVELNELTLEELLIGAMADKASSVVLDIEHGAYIPEEQPVQIMENCSDYPEPGDVPHVAPECPTHSTDETEKSN